MNKNFNPQLFHHRHNYPRRQVSVIRGRVVDTDGMPLTGVKVESPEQPHNGNTYTREEGL